MRGMLARRMRLLANAGHWHRHTARIQLKQLQTLLKTASDTEFGRKHDFARIARLDPAEMLRAYRAAVPVQRFSGFREYTNRMLDDGQPDVLWPGKMPFFCLSSGTTGLRKNVPFSLQMRESCFRAAMDAFAYAGTWGVSLPRLTGGKFLLFSGTTNPPANEHGIRVGVASGIALTRMRWPISAVASSPKDVMAMPDWGEKLERMAQIASTQDIRLVAGLCSWTLVLFERVLELARARDASVRGIVDVWPQMQLLVHAGMGYAPFDARMREAWSGRSNGPGFPYRMDTYSASEAFVSHQDLPNEPSMRLASDLGNFFEFVPLEEVDAPEPRAFACHEVVKGQPYAVVMSTCAGLWRYNIGDVVSFDNIPGDLNGDGGDGPCRLRVVGRERLFMNSFGEKLMIDHIEAAVSDAAKATGLTIREFTAAPDFPTPTRLARLEFAIEFIDASSGPPSAHDLQQFARILDDRLLFHCSTYVEMRTGSKCMVEPAITPLPKGTFVRWLVGQGKLDAQVKVPRCANHREILDAVVATSRQPA